MFVIFVLKHVKNVDAIKSASDKSERTSVIISVTLAETTTGVWYINSSSSMVVLP